MRVVPCCFEILMIGGVHFIFNLFLAGVSVIVLMVMVLSVFVLMCFILATFFLALDLERMVVIVMIFMLVRMPVRMMRVTLFLLLFFMTVAMSMMMRYSKVNAHNSINQQNHSVPQKE